jgi:hypothetical protein
VLFSFSNMNEGRKATNTRRLKKINHISRLPKPLQTQSFTKKREKQWESNLGHLHRRPTCNQHEPSQLHAR